MTPVKRATRGQPPLPDDIGAVEADAGGVIMVDAGGGVMVEAGGIAAVAAGAAMVEDAAGLLFSSSWPLHAPNATMSDAAITIRVSLMKILLGRGCHRVARPLQREFRQTATFAKAAFR